MAKHTASAQISATPDQVWAVVSNGNRLPDWLTPVGTVDSIEPSGALAKGTQLEASIGNIGGAKLKIKEADAGRRLKWSAGPFIAHMMRMPMIVELELQARGESTTATITYKSNPMMAPLMGMMTGLKFGDEAAKTVQALKAAVEG
jgi:hypothetical protein